MDDEIPELVLSDINKLAQIAVNVILYNQTIERWKVDTLNCFSVCWEEDDELIWLDNKGPEPTIWRVQQLTPTLSYLLIKLGIKKEMCMLVPIKKSSK